MTNCPVKNKFRVVLLIARRCGSLLFKQFLKERELEIVGVFTHSLLPKSEDPNRGERPEYKEISALASDMNIPLFVVDTPKDAEISQSLSSLGHVDFLVCLSWRYLVPTSALSIPKITSINLHRGLLPKYAGAKPVQRMLEDGLNFSTITAHHMDSTIDTGKVIIEENFPAFILSNETSMKAAERIKAELDKHYSDVALSAISSVIKSIN